MLRTNFCGRPEMECLVCPCVSFGEVLVFVQRAGRHLVSGGNAVLSRFRPNGWEETAQNILRDDHDDQGVGFASLSGKRMYTRTAAQWTPGNRGVVDSARHCNLRRQPHAIEVYVSLGGHLAAVVLGGSHDAGAGSH